MKKLIIVFCVLFGSCTNEHATVSTLKKAGFTKVETTGWSAFACSDDDTYSTGFIAVNPSGVKVDGTVCCGLFKNCTIRF